MFTTTTILIIVCLYMAFLFAVAQIIEMRSSRSGKKVLQPLIYALAITVYCTSWTFYGSVGFATESGLLYFAIYVGAILAVLCWRQVLAPMIHVKNNYHITSIADFISARYNRSETIAALVTIIALLGTIPYIALQLKAVINSYEIIAAPATSDSYGSSFTGVFITLLMILFTIIFGARRLDSTERHSGIMGVLAVQCLIKLAAFICLGVFVTYNLYDGFADIFNYIAWGDLSHLIGSSTRQGSVFMEWMTLIILGAVSIQCLPRQFHVAVVENANAGHIRTAMWIIPLYLVLISIFVIPIAAAGILQGLPMDKADFFVLLLPQQHGQNALMMLVFIGGFSAATGMIMISAMALSTMATNHLLLIFIERFRGLNFLRQHLLKCRWMMITLILSCSYWFAWEFSDSYMLATMGLISFAAVCQFVPALFGGMFWSKANKVGATLGLLAGLLVWGYTLVFPAFLNHGWFDDIILFHGLFGIEWLRPEALFGFEEQSNISHSVIWSLTFNILFYVIGSLAHQPSKTERSQLTEFMKALKSAETARRARPTGLDAYIELSPKLAEATQLIAEYLPMSKAENAIERIAENLMVSNKESITIIELVEFHRMLENQLSGSIGAASAHKAIDSRITYSSRESKDLKVIYNHILSGLQGHESSTQKSPSSDLTQARYTFVEKLQNQIDQQEAVIKEQQLFLNNTQNSRDRSDQNLFEQRLLNQKLIQEIKKLKLRLNQEIEDGSTL